MANELVSPVVNGQYTKTYASQEASKANETTSTGKSEARKAKGDGYDQEMFLQLLVAEMQYQDPLEPTNNSEYLSQLASFTQIEAIQNVQSGMENIEGNSLVGNYVSLNVNGEEITGIVDFVKKDDEKGLMVSVDGNLYEKSKIVSVVDGDFYMSNYVANLFLDALKTLPDDPKEITVRDGEKIANVTSYYNALGNYPRSLDYIKEEQLKKYRDCYNQYTALVQAVEDAAKKAQEEAQTEEQKAEEPKVQETSEETNE